MWYAFKKHNGGVVASSLELMARNANCSERSDDVGGVFVAEKWVDIVVSVERHNERVLILKMVLDDSLLNVLTVYAPHLETGGGKRIVPCGELMDDGCIG